MPSPDIQVSLPREYAAYLAAEHLNQLWRGSRYAFEGGVVPPGEEEEPPSCSNCCGPCVALAGMAKSGALDEVLQDIGPGYDWWDEAAGQVDRAYLAERLAPYCDYGGGSRCTDLTDAGGEPRCGELKPRDCREQPEHEACRQKRICAAPPDHGGGHTWGHG